MARASASIGSFAMARDFLEDCCRVGASTETERRIALEAGRRTAEARAAGLIATSWRRKPLHIAALCAALRSNLQICA